MATTIRKECHESGLRTKVDIVIASEVRGDREDSNIRYHL